MDFSKLTQILDNQIGSPASSIEADLETAAERNRRERRSRTVVLPRNNIRVSAEHGLYADDLLCGFGV
jgi:hypothetical protein